MAWGLFFTICGQVLIGTAIAFIVAAAMKAIKDGMKK